jgi:hypothetical protein
MAALVSIYTKEEHKGCGLFLWVEVTKAIEIYRHLSAQYGDNVLPQQGVYEWTEMFMNGWRSMTDAECSECLPLLHRRNSKYSSQLVRLYLQCFGTPKVLFFNIIRNGNHSNECKV